MHLVYLVRAAVPQPGTGYPGSPGCFQGNSNSRDTASAEADVRFGYGGEDQTSKTCSSVTFTLLNPRISLWLTLTSQDRVDL